MNDILRWASQKLSDDGELIDVVLAWEEWLSFQHFSKDTTGAPDIDLDVVFLPGKHDFWSTVVSCGDVSGHLWILDSGEAKVANLQIAVLVDEDVAGFEISVDDTSRVDIFQASL